MLAVLIVVTLAVRGCSLVVQAGYIRKRGGAQPLIACAAAFVLVVLVGVPVRLAGLSTLPTIVLGAILEITVVALLIKPGAQTSTYGLSR